jgi:pyruvate,orthophosphate dikinase
MLFVLQTRKAKRSPIAAVKIAVDMVNEKLITEREALLRLDPAQMNFFLHPMIDNTKGNFCMLFLQKI